MSGLTELTQRAADLVWGTPLVSLLLGGGLFFLILSRATPYRRLGHGIAVLLGRYDTPEAAGEISHKQALAAALSNTMGLGNIAGVALAIVAGGPGAVCSGCGSRRLWVSRRSFLPAHWASCTGAKTRWAIFRVARCM